MCNDAHALFRDSDYSFVCFWIDNNLINLYQSVKSCLQIYAVHDCFKHAGGHDIFLLDWRQVLSYDVSLLNIRLVVNSLIDSV
jgi:hypothetical protein